MMLLSATVVVLLVVGSIADEASYSYTAAPATGYQQPAASTYAAKGASYNYQPGQYTFYGYYAGYCSNDGLYVNGPHSIVVCSNGRAHVQPCAPGTRNSAVRTYTTGAAYQVSDFCNENLNDYAQTGTPYVAPYYPYAYPFAYYHPAAGYPYA